LTGGCRIDSTDGLISGWLFHNVNLNQILPFGRTEEAAPLCVYCQSNWLPRISPGYNREYIMPQFKAIEAKMNFSP
jgi:hypothetical protein